VTKLKLLSSLVASARRLTGERITRHSANSAGWQEDGWIAFDEVGELRFMATTIANRMAQAKLFVGKAPLDPTETIEPIDDPRISGVLSSVGGSAAGLSQMLNRLGVNLFIAGDGWIVGIPRDSGSDVLTMTDLDWRVLSVSEVSATHGGELSLRLGEFDEDIVRVRPEDVVLIRVWRPHPRLWWESDSPTRSSLPVLRELIGLTKHVSAQIDSRLAGAGVFLVPQSAQRALKEADPNRPSDATDDPFAEALLEAMLTPIRDRSSASALVPLTLTVPDESIPLFRLLTFAQALDAETRELRDEAIRRLALGLDAPPEMLLGMGDVNHWTGFMVREDVVTTHIEPPLALICDALTSQLLWPVLIEQGMPEAEARQYVVWYDVSHLTDRTNNGAEAITLHERGVLSDDAVRAANGFGPQDAPVVTPEQLVVQLILRQPQLIETVGVPQLVELLRQLVGTSSSNVPTPVTDTSGVDGPPSTDGVPE
jgi:hypothetical protein